MGRAVSLLAPSASTGAPLRDRYMLSDSSEVALVRLRVLHNGCNTRCPPMVFDRGPPCSLRPHLAILGFSLRFRRRSYRLAIMLWYWVYAAFSTILPLLAYPFASWPHADFASETTADFRFTHIQTRIHNRRVRYGRQAYPRR